MLRFEIGSTNVYKFAAGICPLGRTPSTARVERVVVERQGVTEKGVTARKVLRDFRFLRFQKFLEAGVEKLTRSSVRAFQTVPFLLVKMGVL